MAQYAIWALNIIAVLGRGEEIQNQAVGTVFYLWPQSKSYLSLQVGGIVCNGVVR